MNTARWAMGWTVCVWILIAGQACAQGSAAGADDLHVQILAQLARAMARS